VSSAHDPRASSAASGAPSSAHDAPNSARGDHGHGAGLGLYFGVFAALLVGTWLTVFVAERDLGAWNTPVALGIACTKATLVLLYFMHVRWSSKVVWMAAAIGFVFLVILLGFTISDFATREWLEIYSDPLLSR
jgi:cytochrome c oxidase subunit 4